MLGSGVFGPGNGRNAMSRFPRVTQGKGYYSLKGRPMFINKIL